MPRPNGVECKSSLSNDSVPLSPAIAHKAPPAKPTRFLRRIAAVYALSPEEEKELHGIWAPRTEIPPQTDLIIEGDEMKRGYIIEEGWACRYRLLNDGRCQIINFVLPGDFVGGSGGSIEAADHSVGTLTWCRVHPFQSRTLADIRRRLPALGPAFDWSARRDRAMIQERIVDIGRRTARERMAHLVLELMYRLRLVGLCDGRGFDLPLTQEVMGDALGLSIVHVNRTLRRLHCEGLIRYRPGRIDVIDEDRLAHVAEFDSEYLHQPDFADAREGSDLVARNLTL